MSELDYRDETHRSVPSRSGGVPVCWLAHADEQGFDEAAYLRFAWDAWPDVTLTNDNSAVLCPACVELIHS